MASFVQRMIGAAKLDPAIYEEVEADPTSMGQAMGVVVLSAIADGVGAFSADGSSGFVSMTIVALIAWFVWAFMTWLVGTKMLPLPDTSADMGQLLRTIGFASSPGILQVFGGLPFVGGFISLGCTLWMLAAMVVAVRQALDYSSTGRAVTVCVIGFCFYVGTLAGMALIFGVGVAALTGAFRPGG